MTNKIVLGIVVVIAAVFIWAGLYGNDAIADNQRLQDFKRQRDAWHSRCDEYVDKRTDRVAIRNAEAQTCADQMHELIAYAKTQGW